MFIIIALAFVIALVVTLWAALVVAARSEQQSTPIGALTMEEQLEEEEMEEQMEERKGIRWCYTYDERNERMVQGILREEVLFATEEDRWDNVEHCLLCQDGCLGDLCQKCAEKEHRKGVLITMAGEPISCRWLALPILDALYAKGLEVTERATSAQVDYPHHSDVKLFQELGFKIKGMVNEGHALEECHPFGFNDPTWMKVDYLKKVVTVVYL
jgi:hypothetical protein